jgi:hypothetical protein
MATWLTAYVAAVSWSNRKNPSCIILYIKLAEHPECYCGKIQQILIFLINLSYPKAYHRTNHSIHIAEYHRIKLSLNKTSLQVLEPGTGCKFDSCMYFKWVTELYQTYSVGEYLNDGSCLKMQYTKRIWTVACAATSAKPEELLQGGAQKFLLPTSSLKLRQAVHTHVEDTSGFWLGVLGTGRTWKGLVA